MSCLGLFDRPGFSGGRVVLASTRLAETLRGIHPLSFLTPEEGLAIDRIRPGLRLLAIDEVVVPK